MAKEFLAKDFANRNELEAIIRVEVGDDIERNKDEGHTIRGTRAELKKLHLTDLTTVFGIKCVITDKPTTKISEEKKPK